MTAARGQPERESPSEELGEWLRSVVWRPLLLGFWSFILWGTLYGIHFGVAVFQEGPTLALQRVLSGQDRAAGVFNVALSLCAVLTWLVVALAVSAKRRRSQRDTE